MFGNVLSTPMIWIIPDHNPIDKLFASKFFKYFPMYLFNTLMTILSNTIFFNFDHHIKRKQILFEI